MRFKYLFKYLGFGLIALECPNKKFVNLVEEEEIIKDPMKKDELPVHDDYQNDGDDEVTWTDQGEALVIRRSMNTTHVEDANWLRNNIFHTRCTTNRKLCNLIIDGGGRWSTS